MTKEKRKDRRKALMTLGVFFIIFSLVIAVFGVLLQGNLPLIEETGLSMSIENAYNNRRVWKFVDIRVSDEYEQDHIEDSMNIDYNIPFFDVELYNLSKGFVYIIYDNTGSNTSRAVVQSMRTRDYSAYYLEGGFIAWKNFGEI